MRCDALQPSPSLPGDLEVTLPTDTTSLEHGYEHYDAMCAGCHGAPGVERGETGKGMTPTPPDLAEEYASWGSSDTATAVSASGGHTHSGEGHSHSGAGHQH